MEAVRAASHYETYVQADSRREHKRPLSRLLTSLLITLILSVAILVLVVTLYFTGFVHIVIIDLILGWLQFCFRWIQRGSQQSVAKTVYFSKSSLNERNGPENGRYKAIKYIIRDTMHTSSTSSATAQVARKEFVAID